MLYLKENKQPLHMRYHFFQHYGWFLQNLRKEAVRTNMHTIVASMYSLALPVVNCRVTRRFDAVPRSPIENVWYITLFIEIFWQQRGKFFAGIFDELEVSMRQIKTS